MIEQENKTNEEVLINGATESMKPSEALSPDELQTEAKSRLSDFAKTGTAAKLSGTVHKTSGYVKRKLGELTNDEALKEAGINQELLGKVHRLVGTLREIRSGTKQKIETKKVEGQKILRKHGSKLLDVAYELAEDLKKLILK